MIIVETCPKCGADLTETVICTYPPINRKHCDRCGWSWESQPEEIKRIPFNPTTPAYEVTTMPLITAINSPACEHCSANPKNGGTGVCNCTLGQPEIT